MTLSDFYNSEYFQYWDSDNRSTGSCGLILNDTERFNRIYEAAENGSEGSTHYEIIHDWLDCLNTMDCIDPEDNNGVSDIENGIIQEKDYDTIYQEIVDCENWHEKNGSLHEQLS